MVEEEDGVGRVRTRRRLLAWTKRRLTVENMADVWLVCVCACVKWVKESDPMAASGNGGRGKKSAMVFCCCSGLLGLLWCFLCALFTSDKSVCGVTSMPCMHLSSLEVGEVECVGCEWVVVKGKNSRNPVQEHTRRWLRRTGRSSRRAVPPQLC